MKKLFILFIIFFSIFILLSKGHTPYNYFVRLADAFLHGRLYLTEAPSWLSELIPANDNRWFVVYPPMPAIMLMPFVLIFGNQFPQDVFAAIVASLIIISNFVLYEKLKGIKVAIWVSVLIGFGSIILFMASDGSVWYTGQLVSFLFLSLALLEAKTRKRALLLGFWVGAAYLSRVNTIVSIPFFLYVLFNKKEFIRKYILFALGVSPFIIFNALYNYVRFGVPWDVGYFILPGLLNELNAPWFKHGVMNPLYIPENIKAAFLSFPKRINHFPYLIPSWYGLSIWITSPVFLFSIFAPIGKTINKVVWFIVLSMFLVVAMHGGTGWAQFGYRFAVDFYPFLIYLTIEGVTRKKLNNIHWLFLFLGIIVNLWGVICINKFGLVEF